MPEFNRPGTIGMTRADIEGLRARGYSDAQIQAQIERQAEAGGQLPDAQAYYDFFIRPKELGALRGQLDAVRNTFASNRVAARAGNLGLTQRLGLGGTQFERALGSASSSSLSQALADQVARRRAEYEQEIQNPSRFAAFERLRAQATDEIARRQAAGAAAGTTLGISGAATAGVGTALLSNLLTAPVGGVLLGVGAGLGGAGTATGEGTRARQAANLRALGAIGGPRGTDASGAFDQFRRTTGTDVTPQGSAALALRQLYGQQEEDSGYLYG